MQGSRTLFPSPPPFLIGATVLFWGWASEQWLFGLIGTFLIEGHRWVQWRWPFTEKDYVRIWNICVIFFLILAFLRILDGRFHEVPRAFQRSFPLLLLPMILAQFYGEKKGIPFLTFSLVARKKRNQDKKTGHRLKPSREIHFGYVYFALTLLALGATNQKHPATPYLIAALILYALWPLAAVGRHRLGWIGMVLVAVGCALVSQLLIVQLQGYLEKRAIRLIQRIRSTDHNLQSMFTQIGEVGKLQTSPEILWRVSTRSEDPGQGPRYLRLRAYNGYRLGQWMNHNHRDNIPVKKESLVDEWQIFNNSGEQRVITIKGTLGRRDPILPIPRLTNLIYNLPAKELERNALGSIKARSPASSVAYSVAYGGDLETDNPPLKTDRPKGDLKVTIQAALQRANAHGTRLSAEEKIRRIKRFFAQNDFAYSLYLPNRRRTNSSAALAQFLEESKTGHCEYYATATALMLQAAGVPSRYVVGFFVDEFDHDRDEFVIRGLHAHAWVQAWLEAEKRWVTIDTTPPDWSAKEKNRFGKYQNWQDWWKRWTLDFALWRQSEDKGVLWTAIPLFVFSVLLGIVSWRLFKGLKRKNLGQDELDFRDRTRTGNGLDSEWFLIEESLKGIGFGREPGQTATAWQSNCARRFPILTEPLIQLQEIHYRYRFDPEGISDEDRRLLSVGSRQVVDELIPEIRANLQAEREAEANGKKERY
ncbi:MAG: transglutaminase domain-containing protein [Verrucomicrobiota bacterium]